jgi:hypothetical protein
VENRTVSCGHGETVPRLQHFLWWTALSLIAGALAPACAVGSECKVPEGTCDGNVALTCQFKETGAFWSREDCGNKTCVIGGASGSFPFCALSANPDVRCIEADVPNCAGNTLVQCTVGYATAERTCMASCLKLDDYPDRCSEDPPTGSACMATETDSCAFVVTGNPSYTVLGAPVPTPSGSCPEGGMGAPDGSVNYSQRCQGGALVARTRCAQGCMSHADCTISCQ